MNRYDLLLAALATTFVAGCATPPAPIGGAPDDKTYVTGSRLPSRDGDTAADVKTTANQQGIQDMMSRGSINIPPKPGN